MLDCDQKVQHPSTSINFYRVQGAEGWIFDRRLSTMEREIEIEIEIEIAIQ